MNSDRLTYTVTEAAKLLGIGRTAAYVAARTGQIPAIKLGKRILVPREALRELLGRPSPAPTGANPLGPTEGA